MALVRRFLIAPAFARLVRKERGAVRITEGYFPNQAGRQSYVHVEGNQCHLVLVTPGQGGGPAEERTEVPRGHADALLDVCAGKAIYDRSRLALGGGRDAFVDHLVTPGVVDVVAIEFEQEADANRFEAPAWFGPDVTGQEAYENRGLALNGLPRLAEVPISNAALEALLDTVENRGLSRFSLPPRTTAAAADGGEVLDALRRLASKPEPEERMPAAATLDDVRSTPAAAAAPIDVVPQAATPVAENDSRIDDVIASLSQALGQADAAGLDERQGDSVEVERWGARVRRSQG